MTYYLDRTYTVTTIPPGIEGCVIKTRNSHRSNAELAYLTFSLNVPSTVYVAFDMRNVIPFWLTIGSINTGLRLGTTDVPLTLWRLEVPAGEVVLPGLGQSGNSNYVVIVR